MVIARTASVSAGIQAGKNTCCCFFRVIARMANSPSTTAGAGEILFSGQRDFTSALAAPEFPQIDGSGRERAQPASGICSPSPSPAGLHRPPHPQGLPTTCVDDVSLPPDGRDDACEDGRDANDLDGCTRRDDLGMGRSLSPRRPPHPQFAAAGLKTTAALTTAALASAALTTAALASAALTTAALASTALATAIIATLPAAASLATALAIDATAAPMPPGCLPEPHVSVAGSEGTSQVMDRLPRLLRESRSTWEVRPRPNPA
jgi:hypothetical protein